MPNSQSGLTGRREKFKAVGKEMSLAVSSRLETKILRPYSSVETHKHTHSNPLTFGVVLKDLGPSLAQEAILVQPVLDVSHPGDPVAQVEAEWRQPPAVERVEQVQVPVQVVTVPPHHLLVEVDRLELSVHIVLVAVLGGVGEGADLDLPLGDPAHVVVLDGDPVHERAEDLVLDLLDAAVLVEVFGVGHDGRGDDLRSGRRVEMVDEGDCSHGARRTTELLERPRLEHARYRVYTRPHFHILLALLFTLCCFERKRLNQPERENKAKRLFVF